MKNYNFVGIDSRYNGFSEYLNDKKEKLTIVLCIYYQREHGTCSQLRSPLNPVDSPASSSQYFVDGDLVSQ